MCYKKILYLFWFIKKEKFSLLISLAQRYPNKIYLYISSKSILFEDNFKFLNYTGNDKYFRFKDNTEENKYVNAIKNKMVTMIMM
jgi:hypothetical protein